MWWECPHNRFYSPIWFWLRTHTIPIKYQRHIWRTICYQKCVNEWGASILQYTKCLPVHHTRTTNCDKVFIRKKHLLVHFKITICLDDFHNWLPYQQGTTPEYIHWFKLKVTRCHNFLFNATLSTNILCLFSFVYPTISPQWISTELNHRKYMK